jgi:hypothetical protein
MQVDAPNRPRSGGLRPRGAGSAGSAAEINDLLNPIRGSWQHVDDVLCDQEVLWPVEEREGRALAGRRQRAALRQPASALDVARRQRAERACDLARRQIREVTAFERLEPLFVASGFSRT